MNDVTMKYKACHCCGRIHRIPQILPGQQAVCCRCESIISLPGSHGKSASRTAAAATAAFVLFWPAILCPILRIERLGHSSESSILSGTLELLSHGSWLLSTDNE